MRHLFKQGNKRKYNQGFTLVELLVALTLFVIVVTAAVSSLYTVNNAARKVVAMRSILDNLSFAVESMSRNIRTGTDIVCGGLQSSEINCDFEATKGAQAIMLHSTLGGEQDIEYSLGDGEFSNQIVKRVNDGSGWSEPVALTAPEINISELKFFVKGADYSDKDQPSVMLFIQGEAKGREGDVSPFAIQTFVSQRNIE